MYKCDEVHMHVEAAFSLLFIQCLASFHSYACVVFMKFIEVINQIYVIYIYVYVYVYVMW